mgnify:CR=1 FL=1
MNNTKGFSLFLPYFFLTLIIMLRFLLQDFLFFNAYTPFYELIFIYSWSFIGRFEWNVSILALVGLFRDLLFLDVFGISVVSFCVFGLLVNAQREKIENRGFLLTLVYFIVSLFIILVLRLAIFSFFADIKLDAILVASLKEMYFSVITYPLFFYIILFSVSRRVAKV